MSTSFGPKGALLATTMTSGAQVARSRGVMIGADLSHAIQATANVAILGVAFDNADVAERQFRVVHRAGETVYVESGAAITAPSAGGIVKLATDSVGRFVTATTGQIVAVIAREGAAAAGELIVGELAAPGLLA